jgi:hypothetical protein
MPREPERRVTAAALLRAATAAKAAGAAAWTLHTTAGFNMRAAPEGMVDRLAPVEREALDGLRAALDARRWGVSP